MFLKEIFSVFVDGMFVGICEDENLIWEVAEDSVNGLSILNDDDVDRVFYHRIQHNRFYRDRKNICDKIRGNSILCSNYEDAKRGIIELNDLNIKKERAEAKLRALQL